MHTTVSSSSGRSGCSVHDATALVKRARGQAAGTMLVCLELARAVTGIARRYGTGPVVPTGAIGVPALQLSLSGGSRWS